MAASRPLVGDARFVSLKPPIETLLMADPKPLRGILSLSSASFLIAPLATFEAVTALSASSSDIGASAALVPLPIVMVLPGEVTD